jgi:hypothetical protein
MEIEVLETPVFGKGKQRNGKVKWVGSLSHSR